MLRGEHICVNVKLCEASPESFSHTPSLPFRNLLASFFLLPVLLVLRYKYRAFTLAASLHLLIVSQCLFEVVAACSTA